MEAILTTFLTPLLPFLFRKGEEVADQAIDAVGSAAWERAKEIWSRLRPGVEGDPAAQEAATALATDPGDAAARGALQFGLRKLLTSDPGLADELGRLLEDAKRSGVIAGDGAVVISGGISADRGGVAAGRDIYGGVHIGSGH